MKRWLVVKKKSSLLYELVWKCYAYLVLNTGESMHEKIETIRESYFLISEMSENLYHYILYGCQLAEENLIEEYINILMEYKLYELLQCINNKEEIRLAVFFRHILVHAVYNSDMDYFQMLYSNERDKILISNETDIKIQKMINGFQEWERIFMPTYIPFSYIDVQISGRRKTYLDKNNHCITFVQMRGDFQENLDSSFQYVSFNERQEGYVSRKDSEIQFYWSSLYDQNRYYFYVKSSFITFEEIIKFIKNIKPTNMIE